MNFRIHNRPVLAAGFASVLGALAASQALAAERIRFGDHSEPNSTPKRGLNEDTARPFNIRPSTPEGGDFLPITPPTLKKRDPKVDEWIEQKKNWIYSSPSKIDQDAAIKEIFNVRDPSFTGSEKKTQSSFERYVNQDSSEGGEGNTKRRGDKSVGRTGDTGERRDTDAGAGTGSEPLPLDREPRSSVRPTSELNVNSLTRGGTMPGQALRPSLEPLSGRFGSDVDDSAGFRRGVTGPGGRLSPQEERMKQFQQLIDPGRVRVGTGLDPLGAQTDATRQPLNPIVGGVTPNANGRLDSGLAANPGGLSPLAARPGLDFSGGRGLGGGSSLAPGVSLPSAAPSVSLRPPVLDIPRRKF